MVEEDELAKEARENGMELLPLEKNTYELFFGPQHMATENFSLILKMDGHRVDKAIANPGFLHRGFERLSEHRPWHANVALLLRTCVPEPDVPEAVYSMAVDELMGWDVPERAQWIRTTVLEMARVSHYLFWFMNMAFKLGVYTAGNWAAAYRERILASFERLTGGRVYHIYNVPGGVRRDIPDEKWLDELEETVEYIEDKLSEFDDILFENYIAHKRLKGIGVMDKEYALDEGVTGPNLRATGVESDVRKDDPYLYYSNLDFEVPTLERGDALSRTLIRRFELEEDLYILKQLLDIGPPSGEHQIYDSEVGSLPDMEVPKGDSYSHVEATIGDFGAYVVSDGQNTPYRVQIRGPSISHGIRVLEDMVTGETIADAPVILASLGNCPPDIDR